MPIEGHSGLLMNVDKGFRYHQMSSSPLRFSLKSFWTWRTANITLRYMMPNDGVVMLGYWRMHKLLDVDRPILVDAPILNSMDWLYAASDPLFLYQRKFTHTSVEKWIEEYDGEKEFAQLNFRPEHIESNNMLRDWFQKRTIALPASLRGRHQFYTLATDGTFHASFKIEHHGAAWPRINIRAVENGVIVFSKTIRINASEEKVENIFLKDLPPGTPLFMEFLIDDRDVIHDFSLDAPYLISTGSMTFLNRPKDEIALFTRGTRGISLRPNSTNAKQDAFVDGQKFALNKEHYTFIKGELSKEVHEVHFRASDITVTTETFFALDREDLDKYSFMTAPRIEHLSSLEGIDYVLSFGKYTSPERDGSTRTIKSSFDTFNNFVVSDENLFTLHAFYPASQNTLPLQIIDAKVMLRKDSWLQGGLAQRIKNFYQRL